MSQSANSRIDSYMNKCRACMKEGVKMLLMYDDNVSEINLPYKLAQITSIKIDQFDGLPNMLCPKCAYRTNALYDFRLEVQESDKKFRMMQETKINTLKREQLNAKEEKSDVQKDLSLELNISSDIKSDPTDTFEFVNVKTTDEIDQQQYEIVPQLVENNEDDKENDESQLNDVYYNIIESNEDQMDVQMMKTELPEDISKILTENVTIMYVPKSTIESMSVENTLTLDPEQEEIINDNNTFISEVEILTEETEEASNNVCISSPVEPNAIKKNKCTYSKQQNVTSVIKVEKQEKYYNDMIQNGDKEETKLNESSSNIEFKVENSDESDSDYFVDDKDNILGSVSDAIIRIKEFKRENGTEYQCTLCLQNHNQLTSVLLHTVENHVPSNGPFFCMVCEKDCKNRRELRTHVKTHTGELPYSCFLCKKAYNRKRYLKRHMACHPNFSRHRCLKCGCRFKSKSELDSHATTHDIVAPFACNQCTRVFNHKGNYKRHLISHLDPQGLHLPKYPCTYCNKRFPNNRTLQTHIRVHTGEKPFKCDVCHKSFSQRGNLLNHSKIHWNPRSYTCEVCGKSFNQRATLRDHALLHTGEKPHICNVCGKAFTVSAALRRHMFNHVDVRPFNCDNCGMGFIGKYDLRRHMRVHENRPKEKRKKNTKTTNFLQQKSEESHVALEESKTETVLIEIEEELLSQNIIQTIPQIESEKENEDALFNLQSYSVIYTTEDRS
ncbi:zinc finger and SCAN domain-containing protein 12 isoform X2 [Mycetomoellerius zeteki]|uniref:zinc finger and SCAN domain-containing protein 12 isoform X2 n=1 Tax=Mycetomoellerius zeteki TaxID=64791 RepID=UPI00084E562A|nr:PREDICTED: zinc finger and SCAN domain-containing protein 12-like isoform X2 [Trachymyrmex zeteki]